MSYKHLARLLTGVAATLSLLLLVACSPIEKQAYRVAVGGHAFLMSIQSAHPECNDPKTETKLCTILRQASAAHNLLVDAGKIYCTGGDFMGGGACHPPSKKDPAYQVAADKLQAALTNYEQLESDLRGAYK